MTREVDRALQLLRLDYMPKSVTHLAAKTSQAWPEIRKDWGWAQVGAYQHLMALLSRRCRD